MNAKNAVDSFDPSTERQGKNRLLNLPPELRRTIWDFVFYGVQATKKDRVYVLKHTTQPDNHVRHSYDTYVIMPQAGKADQEHHRVRNLLSLALASKTTTKEVMHALFANVVFKFSTFDRLASMPDSLQNRVINISFKWSKHVHHAGTAQPYIRFMLLEQRRQWRMLGRYLNSMSSIRHLRVRGYCRTQCTEACRPTQLEHASTHTAVHAKAAKPDRQLTRGVFIHLDIDHFRGPRAAIVSDVTAMAKYLDELDATGDDRRPLDVVDPWPKDNFSVTGTETQQVEGGSSETVS
ncbi:Hypothetical protein D9617_24g016230 [Elsinoe fawcettii]|nr:Hypothetical protein D9617_24g016230 [Elsinoe fawcettii]